MTDRMDQAAALRDAFDQIEEAYEFMLAYAAQGRKREAAEGGGESQIRQYLRRFDAGLDSVSEQLASGLGDADGAYTARVQGDVQVARAVLGLLLAKDSISSDMVDNTNGLIAVRTLLTNIFFIDQAVLPPR